MMVQTAGGQRRGSQFPIPDVVVALQNAAWR
jgi:hypothetical protein